MRDEALGSAEPVPAARVGACSEHGPNAEHPQVGAIDVSKFVGPAGSAAGFETSTTGRLMTGRLRFATGFFFLSFTRSPAEQVRHAPSHLPGKTGLGAEICRWG
jgi:hypothetical protein